MKIEVLPLSFLGANCYMLSTDKAAIVIDPGFKDQKVTNFLLENSHKQRMILLTHAHYDHIGAAFDLRRETDTKIAIGELENPSLSDVRYNLSDMFRAKLEPFSADVLLKDGQQLAVGDIEFTVFHTPGHTRGGVCYLVRDCLFSGDTLFNGSIGRTDFLDGDFSTLERSIHRLYTLDDEIVVYPGHGAHTTIKNEKTNNPFVRGI